MTSKERPTPLDSDIPGGWIETTTDPIRHQSYVGLQYNTENVSSPCATEANHGTFISNAYDTSSGSFQGRMQGAGLFSHSGHSTGVPSPEIEPSSPVHDEPISQGLVEPIEQQEAPHKSGAATPTEPLQEEVMEEPVEKLVPIESNSSGSDHDEGRGYAAIKPADSASRPQLQQKKIEAHDRR